MICLRINLIPNSYKLKQNTDRNSPETKTKVNAALNNMSRTLMKYWAIHFNSQGHSLDNLRVQIIEKVCPNTTHTLLEREKLWIQKLATRKPLGLNSHD